MSSEKLYYAREDYHMRINSDHKKLEIEPEVIETIPSASASVLELLDWLVGLIFPAKFDWHGDFEEDCAMVLEEIEIIKGLKWDGKDLREKSDKRMAKDVAKHGWERKRNSEQFVFDIKKILYRRGEIMKKPQPIPSKFAKEDAETAELDKIYARIRKAWKEEDEETRRDEKEEARGEGILEI